jgi:hypothetical protein
VLDENHSDTLASVANLALDLRALGEHEQARVLTDNTMAHRRRMLGEGPPTTRITGYNHAVNLHAADEHKHTSEKTEPAWPGAGRGPLRRSSSGVIDVVRTEVAREFGWGTG